LQVVGVVEDVRQVGLDQDPDPQVFVDLDRLAATAPAGPGGPTPYFAVRTDGDPTLAVATLRSLVRQLDPRATMDNVVTMEGLVSNSIARPRLYAVLLGIFAGVAVVLAVFGIYGVMAYAVAQRTREIGIRMALGARGSKVVRLVLSESVGLTAVGMVLGLFGAAAVTRYLEGMLFGLTPLDPLTFVAVAVVFSTIASLAAFVPARRATRIDPMVALRCE
jgi:predicted lysophospholipase L1 biosynthesis ABC-type transport system permease subunit